MDGDEPVIITAQIMRVIEPLSTESREPSVVTLQALAEKLADCVDRLDAAGMPVEANHVDHGRALVALRLQKWVEEEEAQRLRDAAAALLGVG